MFYTRETVIASLNSPQREGLPYFKTGISVIKKIKLTMETRAGERFSFSESQGAERTDIFLELDLNQHSVLAALLIDGKDFCGDGSHLWRFQRLTSPEMKTALRELQARTGTRGGERVKRTLALVTGERELYSRKRQSDDLSHSGVAPRF
jgi:hypothetical protein